MSTLLLWLNGQLSVVPTVLYSVGTRISISTKLKLYNTCMLPIFLYGSWVLGSYQESCTQDQCSWSVMSKKAVRNKCYHHVQDGDMRWTTKQLHLSDIIQARRFSLFGHSVWMPDKTDAKKILMASPLENWRTPPGRLHTTWIKTIQQDLKSNNLSLNEAVDVSQNRTLKRLMSTFGITLF